MSLRAPALAALAVLLVMVGAAFVLTSEAGVNTTVLSADPTATPLPAPSAANWQETQPGLGQYQYIGSTQNMVMLNVQYTTFNEFLLANGMEAPAEDAATPLLDVMINLEADIQQSADENGLVTDPDLAVGPQVEDFGGVPVTLMRLTVPPQTGPAGQTFPGVEFILAWVLQDGQMARAEVQYQGTPEPMIYYDFRAWLEENAPSLVEQLQANAADAAEASAPAEDTPPADTEDTPPADTSDTSTQPPADTSTPGDDDTSAAPAEDTGPWVEVIPGMYQHVTAPDSTLLGIDPFTLDELAAGVGYVVPENEAISALDIMEFQAGLIQDQFDAAAGQFEPGEINGPTETEVEGVPLITLSFTITVDNGVTSNHQYTYLALVPVGDDFVNAVTFQYIYEGDADQQIFDDYDAWLVENIEDLATMPDDAAAVDDTADDTAVGEGSADDAAGGDSSE